MITLRPATENDCRMVWQWANDAHVRAVSFSQESIPYTSHIKWFKSKLDDPGCVYYIAEGVDHEPVGQVRYDLDRNQATISVSLDGRFQNRGYGSQIIARASHEIFATTGIHTIHAYVKTVNTGSVKAFEKAGFKLKAKAVVNHKPTNHFILTKEDLT